MKHFSFGLSWASLTLFIAGLFMPILLSTKSVHAALVPLVYNTTESTACGSSTHRFITPNTVNGKEYWCVEIPEGLNFADAVTITQTTSTALNGRPNCPDYQGAMELPGGIFCFDFKVSPVYGETYQDAKTNSALSGSTTGDLRGTRGDPVCQLKNKNDAAEKASKPAFCGYAVDCSPKNGAALSESNCGIILWLLRVINVMAGLVGVVVVMMIVVGGIQYSMSSGDPAAVTAARKKIYNALLALVSFIFMWSFLQWVIPGGIF